MLRVVELGELVSEYVLAERAVHGRPNSTESSKRRADLGGGVRKRDRRNLDRRAARRPRRRWRRHQPPKFRGADGSGRLGFGEVRTKEEECKRDSDRLKRFPCSFCFFFFRPCLVPEAKNFATL